MNLPDARAEKGLTQWGLVKAVRSFGKSINQTKLSLYENGYISLGKSDKAAIAKALGLAIDDIDWDEER